MLALDGLMDVLHLFQRQLACQHHHVGKLCIEAQRRRVRDVHLGGKVKWNLAPPAPPRGGNGPFMGGLG